METKLLKRAVCILGFSLMIAIPCFAENIDVSYIFQTSNQSMWDSGSATIIDWSHFYGIPLNLNPHIGGIGCVWGICGGAELGANITGHLGVDLGFHLDSGFVNATLPTQISLSAPVEVNPAQGQTFAISGIADYDPGLLTTASPTVSAYADLNFALGVSVYAEACAGACARADADIIPYINPTFTLVGINQNNDGQLSLLGGLFTEGLPYTGSIGSYGSFTLSLPQISTSSYGNPPLNSSGTTDFLEFDVNALNIAANLMGFPPLSGSYGGFDYNILSAGFGLGAGLYQNFSLTPNVLVTLDVAETGQIASFYPGLGQNADINIPTDANSLHITPTYSMEAQLSNNTGFNLQPNIWASGGSIGYSSLSLGPLFDVKYQIANLPVSVFTNTFALGGFDSFTGPTFEVKITPEPGSLLLLASGLAVFLAFGFRSQRTRKD